MIKSMSGHGRAEAADERLRVIAEIRSVNHRFCRVSVRLPAELIPLEERVRRQVQACVQRGKVDVTVSVSGPGGQGNRLDTESARGWGQQLHELAAAVGTAGPTLADVLAMPGVIGGEGAIPAGDSTARLVDDAVAAALQAYDGMRGSEGQDMADDLAQRAQSMRETVERIERVADELPARTRDQLRERIAELLADTGTAVAEERIVQEAAHLAERGDVTEEIVRLRSHLEKLDTLLQADEAVGRTLEFVTQEIHRELNTIGSKTKELSVAEDIVVLKAELERVREQVQNIE